MQFFLTMLQGGVQELLTYLSAHVITCLVPAFFIAGAMAVLITQGAVIKYFGVQAKRWVAYGVASISGMLLAVCSCTVLPLLQVFIAWSRLRPSSGVSIFRPCH